MSKYSTTLLSLLARRSGTLNVSLGSMFAMSSGVSPPKCFGEESNMIISHKLAAVSELHALLSIIRRRPPEVGPTSSNSINSFQQQKAYSPTIYTFCICTLYTHTSSTYTSTYTSSTHMFCIHTFSIHQQRLPPARIPGICEGQTAR